MRRFFRALAPWLVVAIFVGAVWLLYRELKHYHYHDIVQSLRQIPTGRVWAAVALTATNYAILVGYDLLAVRSIGHRLSSGKVAVASFVGYVTSYNFGTLLGGTSARYRLYSVWGLSSVEIFRLLALLFLTFWVGFFFLAGIVFVADPVPIPPRLHILFASVRPLGIALLAATAVYLVVCARRTRPMRLLGWEFALPSLRLAVCQIGIACADLLVAAAVLYILLPASVDINYPHFLSIYLLAIVAVLLSHVPGGLGVFELVILLILSPTDPTRVIGSLLVYRAVYYLLPLALAAAILAMNELLLRKVEVKRLLEPAVRLSSWLAPWILSLLIFLAGTLLLFSGATPAAHHRLGWLRQLLPLPVVEMSHFLGSIVGVGLLLLARGLQRRLDSAYWLAVLMLVWGVIFSLLKGLDFEEATILAVMLAILLASRRGFYRKGSLFRLAPDARWAAALLCVLLCSVWLGLFAYKHVEYSNELWWSFSFRGNAPRSLRATAGGVTLLLLAVTLRLLRPAIPKPAFPNADELAVAATIIVQSPATYANLALLGDKQLLFDKTKSAFIMYAVAGRSWVAMRDPVGAAHVRSELLWDFRELCDQYAGQAVFYQVAEETLPSYLDMGLSLVKLGEEAHVPLVEFSLEGAGRRSLRQTGNRFQREGCVFEIIPAGDVGRRLPELENVSDAWLRERKTAEKGFSLGRFNTNYIARYPVAVVRREGNILGFANLWLGAGKKELSVDLMRYVPEAPSGVMEYLFTEVILWGKQQGYQWFNLGMAPLSGLESRSLAPVWSRFGDLVFRHGEHFYGFQGLRQYKEKFRPHWRPKYLASPGGFALPRILKDIATLISGGTRQLLVK
jgi:phosphatidylglycerol lysyltransferase